MDQQVILAPRHRASYTLERGVWSATCRTCGYSVKDSSRSRAATWFLAHIRAKRRESGNATSQPASPPLADDGSSERPTRGLPKPRLLSVDGFPERGEGRSA